MSELHLPELTLRRVFAGELAKDQADQARQHAAECTTCRAKLRSIEEEQQKFEQEISLERFKAGVQRAARGSTGAPRSAVGYAVMAAAAMLFVFAIPAIIVMSKDTGRSNAVKGGGVDLYIAPVDNGPQRIGSPSTAELLTPGDRVRIAYNADGYRYVAAVSVDEAGEVTALYPQTGLSMKVSDPFAKTLLPETWEFTGKGAETILVVFTDRPVDLNDISIATKDAWERAGGNVQALPDVYLPGLQISQVRRTLLKP